MLADRANPVTSTSDRTHLSLWKPCLRQANSGRSSIFKGLVAALIHLVLFLFPVTTPLLLYDHDHHLIEIFGMTSQLVSSSSFTWQQSNVSSALAHNSHCEQSLASLRVASHAETSAEQCDSGVANSLKPYVDLVNIPVALELGDGQIRSRSRVSRIHTVRPSSLICH